MYSIHVYIYIYIYIYGQPPPKKKPTFLTLIAKFAPLNQTFVCKTHYTAADMTLRETMKTQKTQKTTKSMCFVVFCVFEKQRK